jgi:CRISPR-associated protein Csb1
MDTLEIVQGSASCLTVRAHLEPVARLERFQPAGFPEIGHVIYDAPLRDGAIEKICIVDSAASMANHLESVSLAGGESIELHEDLTGLPYVACVTQEADAERTVCTTLTEGHRLASDYFLKATLENQTFREVLRDKMRLRELAKDKKYFFYPDGWGDIYKAVFHYDPNSLVHGLLFAREEIKISRVLTAHLEAHGAQRVLSSGVKFDKLGKTLSGQPIFAVDEEVATDVIATFTIDLGLLRSYGRDAFGLREVDKLLLLELSLWKIARLTMRPFRFRSGCHLKLKGQIEWLLDDETTKAPDIEIRRRIADCRGAFAASPTKVSYPASELYRVEKTEDEKKKGRKKKPGPEPEAGDNEAE